MADPRAFDAINEMLVDALQVETGILHSTMNEAVSGATRNNSHVWFLLLA